MPKNEIGPPPFPPVEFINVDGVVGSDVLGALIERRRDGVTLCVRSTRGLAKRGGYFFHAQRTADGRVQIFDFEAKRIAELNPDEFVEFVNHCTGAQFSEAMWSFCLNTINLRTDPE